MSLKLKWRYDGQGVSLFIGVTIKGDVQVPYRFLLHFFIRNSLSKNLIMELNIIFFRKIYRKLNSSIFITEALTRETYGKMRQ